VIPQTPYRHPSTHAFAALLVLLAGLVAALAFSGTGTAGTSACGEKVLNDWFDNGRVDRIYDYHCYEDAIDAIPRDIRDYADAEEVINRALQGALQGKLVRGGVDPSDDGGGGAIDPGDPPEGTTEVTPDVDTSAASSVPIPLLVLGGMSLALLAAGGLGYLSRRRSAAGADGPDDPAEPLS
jgi:hypothetical protein